MILIVDTETTGFDPKKDLCIEVAVAQYDDQRGCLIRCWSEVVQAESNAAEHVNGIKADMLLAWGMLAPPTVRDDHARCVVAHNASFDRQWVLGIEKPWVCSVKDIRWPKGSGKLETLALNHGVAVTPGHRAIYDVLTLVRVFDSLPMWGTTAKALIDDALQPRKLYRSCQSFARNKDAQALGFAWDGKMWTQRLDEAELMAVVERAAFPIVEVGK